MPLSLLVAPAQVPEREHQVSVGPRAGTGVLPPARVTAGSKHPFTGVLEAKLWCQSRWTIPVLGAKNSRFHSVCPREMEQRVLAAGLGPFGIRSAGLKSQAVPMASAHSRVFQLSLPRGCQQQCRQSSLGGPPPPVPGLLPTVWPRDRPPLVLCSCQWVPGVCGMQGSCGISSG